MASKRYKISTALKLRTLAGALRAGVLNPTANKAELRKSIKAALTALAPETLSAAGSAAAHHLRSIPRWESFPSVLAFLSMKDEIDTRPILEAALKAGKALFAPRVEGEALAFYRIGPDSGPFASPSPHLRVHLCNSLICSFSPLLVLTPGLAFDRRLHRLGRGGGYYDRFFADLDAAGQDYTAVGLCMDCQIADEVPVCPRDKNMDLLLTESGVVLP